jgi:hypothetical protein
VTLNAIPFVSVSFAQNFPFGSGSKGGLDNNPNSNCWPDTNVEIWTRTLSLDFINFPPYKNREYVKRMLKENPFPVSREAIEFIGWREARTGTERNGIQNGKLSDIGDHNCTDNFLRC